MKSRNHQPLRRFAPLRQWRITSVKLSHTALLVAFVALVTLVVASCGNGETTSGKRTIRFWHFWTESGQLAALKQVVARFEQEHNCTVELTGLSWKDGKTKLQAAFNSGEPPDVIELGSDWVAQFSSAGVLDNLAMDSMALSRFVPYSMASAMWDGKLYAYPWTLDTRVLYVNTDMLAKAGWTKDITTMDDMLAASRAVQSTGAYGFAASGADVHRLYKKILPFMWSMGGDILDANGKPVFYTPQNIKAFTMYADLARTGFMETQRELDAAFQQGKVAMWQSGSWLLTKLKATPALKFKAVLMPGDGSQPGLSFAGGEYLSVSNASKEKQTARAFVRFMSDGKNSVDFCSSFMEAGFPADKSFYLDPKLTSDPQRAVFAKQLEFARMTPVHPKWLELEALLEDAVVKVLLGEAPPEKALEAAQYEASKIM
ncbi:MAG: extracellular solute-binding protein [bacterium]|nr:extracellular solute-binding protein [bacterium]